HRDQFTSRQYAHHARGLRPREHITLRAPHDHGRARQAPEHWPQCGAWRRAVLDPLLDVRGVHLPDPAAVWSLPKHAKGKLTLVAYGTAGRDGRDLASGGHGLSPGPGTSGTTMWNRSWKCRASPLKGSALDV